MAKLCRECKTLNDDEAEYCKNCGINLTEHNNEKTGLMDNETFQVLFCWKDDYTSEFRLGKTKIAFWIVFFLAFTYDLIFNIFIYDVELNIILSFFIAILSALIFSVPVFAIGYIIHRILH